MLVGDAFYFLESRGYNVDILKGEKGRVVQQDIIMQEFVIEEDAETDI